MFPEHAISGLDCIILLTHTELLSKISLCFFFSFPTKPSLSFLTFSQLDFGVKEHPIIFAWLDLTPGINQSRADLYLSLQVNDHSEWQSHKNQWINTSGHSCRLGFPMRVLVTSSTKVLQCLLFLWILLSPNNQGFIFQVAEDSGHPHSSIFWSAICFQVSGDLEFTESTAVGTRCPLQDTSEGEGEWGVTAAQLYLPPTLTPSQHSNPPEVYLS